MAVCISLAPIRLDCLQVVGGEILSLIHIYFVDGYHGGIYGHYPVKWKTQFIVDQLAMHPDLSLKHI